MASLSFLSQLGVVSEELFVPWDGFPNPSIFRGRIWKSVLQALFWRESKGKPLPEVVMPLYPLGISRRRDVPSVPKQAAGSVDVRWSFAGELACAFIDAPHHAVPPMLHATVLEAIHRRVCVLPVRFGVALRDESEIHSMLDDRRHELLDGLSRLDWTCEMGVQIAPLSTTETPAAVSPGRQSPRAYIEQRRSHYRLRR